MEHDNGGYADVYQWATYFDGPKGQLIARGQAYSTTGAKWYAWRAYRKAWSRQPR